MECCVNFTKWRWISLIMTHLIWFIIFSHRYNLSIAIVAMTTSHISSENISPSNREEVNNLNATDTGKFAWTELEKGNALGSYYYGYTISAFPASYLSDKFGSKYILCISLFLS